jgi:tetratricopeptide (TPR) repeat protein
MPVRNDSGLRASAVTGRRLPAALLLLALGGCSLWRPGEPAASAPTAAVPEGATLAPAPPPAAPPATAFAGAPTIHHELGAAARALIGQAGQQESKGDLEAAAATLERAVRIEPRNPLVWVEYAHLKLLAQNAREAESLARRALSLAGEDPRAQAKGYGLLAQALRAQGRNGEAHEAELRAAAAN